MSLTPYGYCHCGCGQKAPIASRTRASRGWVKGEPRRYLPDHWKGNTSPPPPNPSGLCMCGCGKRTPLVPRTDSQKGWLAGHPLRYLRGHTGIPPRPAEERFWSKVEKTDLCWIWRGAKVMGYGYFAGHGNPFASRRAPRIAYELLVGPIPAEMVLDHLCRNRACVNPDHLEPVTHQENLRRGFPGRRPFTGNPLEGRNAA